MLITLPRAAQGGRPAQGLHGRPMYMAKVDDACGVWFLTAIDSTKVEELERESEAYVVAQGSARQVMMEGRAEVVEDSEIIDELWNPGAEMWFDGREDPRVCALHFVPSRGEYWDGSGKKRLRFLFEAAKALVTGEPPAEVAKHGEVVLPGG
jgi:general stress protein 26